MDERPPFEEIAAQGSPATPEALKAIVARHRRGRTRTLGVALAVALVGGPVVGWAVGHSGGGGQQVATGSQPDASNAGGAANRANAPAAGAASGQAFVYPDKNPPKTTHLFNRTSSDGIAIRAYRMDPPPPPSGSTSTTTPSPKTQEAPCPAPGNPGPSTATARAESGATASASASSGSSGGGQAIASPPAPDGTPGTVISGTPPPCGPIPPPCNPTPSVLAEASNDAAVGQSFDPIDAKQPSDALSHLAVGMFGVPEGSPAKLVTVQTGPGVATVRLRLPSGATDEMAPSGGVAVLAHGSSDPTPAGTVEALDASGKVLASMDLAQPGPKTAFACAYAGPLTARPLPAPATPPTTR